MKQFKKVGALILSTALAFSLGGCSGSKTSTSSNNSDANTTTNTTTSTTNSTTTPTSDKVSSSDATITVWCWDPAFNIYAMKTAADIYKEINPGVTVNIVETPWEDVQTKLTTAVTSGQTSTLPDIILMQDNALQKNVENYPDAFVDLTNSGIDFSQFASYKTAIGTIDGKNYNVPFDNGATGMFVRTDYLEQAGYKVDDLKGITWSKFIEIGKVVLEKTGKPLLSSQAGSPDLICIMLQSAGVGMFKEDGSVYMTDNDVLKAAMKVYQDLLKSGVLVEVNDWDQYIGTINNEVVAGTLNGCWIIGSIVAKESQKGLWAVTDIPKLEGVSNATNYSNNGGSGWMVLSASKNPEIAMDFLAKTFAGSTELYETILPSSGALATYLPAGKSEVYSAPNDFFGGQTIYMDITDFAAKIPSVKPGKYYYEARDAVGVAITQIVSGTDFDKALKQAEDTVKFAMGE